MPRKYDQGHKKKEPHSAICDEIDEAGVRTIEQRLLGDFPDNTQALKFATSTLRAKNLHGTCRILGVVKTEAAETKVLAYRRVILGGTAK